VGLGRSFFTHVARFVLTLSTILSCEFTFGSTDILLVATLHEDEGFRAHRTMFIAWFGML
jgi:hypothetical protein